LKCAYKRVVVHVYAYDISVIIYNNNIPKYIFVYVLFVLITIILNCAHSFTNIVTWFVVHENVNNFASTLVK